MRAYTVNVVAAALGVDPRWVDNVLSTHSIDGVTRERQGVTRKIAPDAILAIAVARDLAAAVGASLGVALNLAAELIRSGEHSPAPGVTIRIDLDAVKGRLAARLAEAVDSHPPAQRGRPRESKVR
jgi:hypothetical protein